MSEKYIDIPCDFEGCNRNISPGTLYYEMEPCHHKIHKNHVIMIGKDKKCPVCQKKIDEVIMETNLETKDALKNINKGGRFTRRKRRSTRRRRTRGRRRH
jgi:hypothetical protein